MREELSGRSAGGFYGSQTFGREAAVVGGCQPADRLGLQRGGSHGHRHKCQRSGVAESATMLVRVLMGMLLSEGNGLGKDDGAQHQSDA